MTKNLTRDGFYCSPPWNSSEFSCKTEFLAYMDSRGILNDLKVAASEFKKNANAFLHDDSFIPPFRFPMKIDLLRIQETYCALYALLTENPYGAVAFAEELVYYALKELATLENMSKSDIQVAFDITSFPNIYLSNDHRLAPSNGLKAINGILLGRSAAYKYWRSTVYKCVAEQCELQRGKRFPQTFDGNCPFCCSRMEEDARCRDFGEGITGHIIRSDAFKNSGLFQSIRVDITDEVCSSIVLQIGEEYNLIGTAEGDAFKVWNMSRRPARFEMLSRMGDLYSLPVPEAVAHLYHNVNQICPTSPWSFVGALASLLASDSVPVSSFLQLKCGLLLSLATQNSENPPVPIAVVGSETSAANKLMTSAGQLAERYVNYSAGYAQLGGEKCQTNKGETWYEAGAMVFASNGACNLGEWSRFKREQMSYVCRVVESGQILLANKDKPKREEDFVAMKSVLWTYWSHVTCSVGDRSQLKTLIDAMGIPFVGEETDEVEIEKTCSKILQISASSNAERFSDSKEELQDFKEYIALANSRQLSLNEQASGLIRDFFVIVRRERPECLPVGAIKTITSLAEAHARLALRREITYEDVVAVLYLYNRSISFLFGRPLVETQRRDFDEFENVCEYIHESILNFKLSLEEHMGNYLFV